MIEKTNKFLIFLIFISIFVNSLVFATKPVELYVGYIAYLLLFPVFILRFRVPGYLLAIFLFLLLTGILNIFLGNNSIPQFSKVFIGVFLSYLFYYYVVAQFEFNVEKLFNIYLIGCYVVSVIGIIQFISYLINFVPGYNYSWLLNKWGVPVGGNFGIRVNSIFGEPTYFGACVSAGAFVSIYNLMVKKPYFLSRFKSVVIIAAYMLTFSSLAYFALFITIIIILVNFGLVKYILFFGPILLFTFYYLHTNVTEFRERYESTINIFLTGEFSIGKTHGSSIVLYNNYRVASKNFSTNFVFGTGLGSHPFAFEKYSITKHIKTHGFALNNQDANSMLLRLVSETGLFGVALMLGLAFRYFVKRKPDDGVSDHFWIISGAILTMILVNLFRQGHYFLNGFPFFIWLYYYNYINYKKELKTEFNVIRTHQVLS